MIGVGTTLRRPRAFLQLISRGEIMLRVLRTEFYPTDDDIELGEDWVEALQEITRSPRICSTAWFPSGMEDAKPLQSSWFTSRWVSPLFAITKQLQLTYDDSTDKSVPALPTIGSDIIEQLSSVLSNFNISAITRLAEADVVVQRSPPLDIPLKGLLSKSASTVIGTYLGYAVAGDHTSLLLASVPGGIIVVGTAIGVSRALETGFAQLVRELLTKMKRNLL
jgi:hypothetical protein